MPNPRIGFGVISQGSSCIWVRVLRPNVRFTLTLRNPGLEEYGVCQIRVTFLQVPILRIKVFGGLCGPCFGKRQDKVEDRSLKRSIPSGSGCSC